LIFKAFSCIKNKPLYKGLKFNKIFDATWVYIIFGFVINGVKVRARFYWNVKYNTNFSKKSGVGFHLTLSKFWVLRWGKFQQCFFIQLAKEITAWQKGAQQDMSFVTLKLGI